MSERSTSELRPAPHLPLMQSSLKHAVIGEQEVFSLSVADGRQLFDKHTKCHNYAVEYYIIACVHLLRDSNVTGRKEGHVLFNEIAREETRYSFRLAARVLLYAPSHRQDSTYHGLCYTSRGALDGTRNYIYNVRG